jgi:hypothetical protein
MAHCQSTIPARSPWSFTKILLALKLEWNKYDGSVVVVPGGNKRGTSDSSEV